MSIPILTFFNNKGGVGKTSLVYHLSWMFSELGHQVIAMDIDPQANLTSAFLEEDKLVELWDNDNSAKTIYKCIEPLIKVGDLRNPILEKINDNLHLVSGDLALARFEDGLSEEWPKSLGEEKFRPFRILTAFWEIAQRAAEQVQADLILIDVGPNLGAINRSALIASDFIIIPLGADLFSLQGLKNLGPTLRSWKDSWTDRVQRWKSPEFKIPNGSMKPLGYIVQQHSIRLSRPIKSYEKWVNRMPDVYRINVLQETESGLTPKDDPYCLATIKHFRSLIPMSQDARKPVFKLTVADGAIGAHTQAVQEAYYDFENLANDILKRIKS